MTQLQDVLSGNPAKNAACGGERVDAHPSADLTAFCLTAGRSATLEIDDSGAIVQNDDGPNADRQLSSEDDGELPTGGEEQLRTGSKDAGAVDGPQESFEDDSSVDHSSSSKSGTPRDHDGHPYNQLADNTAAVEQQQQHSLQHHDDATGSSDAAVTLEYDSNSQLGDEVGAGRRVHPAGAEDIYSATFRDDSFGKPVGFNQNGRPQMGVVHEADQSSFEGQAQQVHSFPQMNDDQDVSVDLVQHHGQPQAVSVEQHHPVMTVDPTPYMLSTNMPVATSSLAPDYEGHDVVCYTPGSSRIIERVQYEPKLLETRRFVDGGMVVETHHPDATSTPVTASYVAAASYVPHGAPVRSVVYGAPHASTTLLAGEQQQQVPAVQQYYPNAAQPSYLYQGGAPQYTAEAQLGTNVSSEVVEQQPRAAEVEDQPVQYSTDAAPAVQLTPTYAPPRTAQPMMPAYPATTITHHHTVATPTYSAHPTASYVVAAPSTAAAPAVYEQSTAAAPTVIRPLDTPKQHTTYVAVTQPQYNASGACRVPNIIPQFVGPDTTAEKVRQWVSLQGPTVPHYGVQTARGGTTAGTYMQMMPKHIGAPVAHPSPPVVLERSPTGHISVRNGPQSVGGTRYPPRSVASSIASSRRTSHIADSRMGPRRDTKTSAMHSMNSSRNGLSVDMPQRPSFIRTVSVQQRRATRGTCGCC